MRRGFCGYDCYRRHNSFVPFSAGCADSPLDTETLAPLGLTALLTAASCWLEVGAEVSKLWMDTAARPRLSRGEGHPWAK